MSRRKAATGKSYDERRDFAHTPEPKGGRMKAGRKPRFVVQEHKASTHHFDFRIEVEGVLKSWAVPKGPSTDPRTKRLAIPVEDHPLAYADFEGVIPKGEYGGGAVIVRDRGPYDNITLKRGKLQPLSEALERGHVLIRLHGEKLKGGFALQRTGSGKAVRWLLVKTRDDEADARRRPASSQPQTVVSGRTVDGLAREAGASKKPRRRSVNSSKAKTRDRKLTLDGHEVELSSTGKVLFPDAGLTKGDLIDYYRRIAPIMLPHLVGRPISLQRYPDGIAGEGFFQKNAPDYFPSWIERAALAKEDGTVDYVVARDAATLVYLANQGSITLHVGLSRTDRIDRPDRLVIDLDPPGDDFGKVKR
ncbi:MAG: DNA polymerase ligase N-terminal domain-containing protein, partial [Geminicoccaceae bacterium]